MILLILRDNEGDITVLAKLQQLQKSLLDLVNMFDMNCTRTSSILHVQLKIRRGEGQPPTPQ